MVSYAEMCFYLEFSKLIKLFLTCVTQHIPLTQITALDPLICFNGFPKHIAANIRRFMKHKQLYQKLIQNYYRSTKCIYDTL